METIELKPTSPSLMKAVSIATSFDWEEALIFYKGPLSATIISEIGKDIKEKLNNHPKAGRDVFSIFMELAQNIYFYSDERTKVASKDEGIGVIALGEDQEGYSFICGNMVANEHVEGLLESSEKINSLDREDLRKHKRETLLSGPGERSKGAGIGLIKVALTSETPLKVYIQNVDIKRTFFSVHAYVAKK